MNNNSPEVLQNPPLWFGSWGVRATTLAGAKQAHLESQWPLLTEVQSVMVDAFTQEVWAPASDRLFNYRYAHTWVQEHAELRKRLLNRLMRPMDSPDEANSIMLQVDILLAGMISSGLQQEHLNAFYGRVVEVELQSPGFRQNWPAALTQDPVLVNLVGLLDGQANYARFGLDDRVTTAGVPTLPNRLLNPAWFEADNSQFTDAAPGTQPEVVVGTTSERTELARKTTNRVAVFGSGLMIFLALVIGLVGTWLAGRGQASASGSLIVAGAFLAVASLMWWSMGREYKRAQQFVSSDGGTQFRVSGQALTIGDTVIPFDQVTGIFFNLEKEIYSSGGISGEVMAQRLGLAERESFIGRSAGAFAGTQMRRKLYAKGAKSWAEMTVGVVGKESLLPTTFKINPMHSLPKSGLNSGRIDIPVGAYLTRDHLVVLFEALTEPARKYGFPMGVVAGVMNWAQAQTMLSRSPEAIRKEASDVLPR